MKKRNLLKTFLNTITKRTLCYKVFNTIYWLCAYIKDYLYVKDTFYSEQFFYVLRSYLNTTFTKDWIGRVYGVVNPSIDINGHFDISKQIIEFTEDGMSTDNYVASFVYKQMSLIKSVFNLKSSGFFDIIGATITHVGPPNADNWLIVFDIVARKQCTNYLKKTFKQLVIYSILALISYFIYKFSINY